MNMLLRVCLLLFGVLPAASLLADAEREISTALEYYAEVWNEGDFEMIRAYYHPDFMLVTAQGAVPLAERFASSPWATHTRWPTGGCGWLSRMVRRSSPGFPRCT
jgi:hypothetical protein